MPGCEEPAEGADSAAGEEECHLFPGWSEQWGSLLSFALTPGAPLGRPRISDLSSLLSYLYTVFLLPPGAQVLLRCLALLQRLLQEHRLKTQSELDRINAQYLEIKCSAMILKLR